MPPLQPYILYALGAMILYGAAPLLHKAIPKLSAPLLILIYSAVGFVLTAVIIIANPELKTQFLTQFSFQNPSFIIAIATGLLINAAFILYIAALRSGPASAVVIIRNLSIPVTVIAAILLFSETMTITKGIGIILGMLSIILLVI